MHTSTNDTVATTLENNQWIAERPQVSIELRVPGAGVPKTVGHSSDAWLAEVREIRGRVFYDNGRRPFFRSADGRFVDADPVDLESFHIVARAGNRTIGCARATPLAAGSGFISFTVGEQRFEQILQELGVNRHRTCEAARWAVLPEWRGELGARLVAGCWVVVRRLGFDGAFVLACTSAGQDLALIRMGARAVQGVPLFPSRISDDALRLLYFDAAHPSARIQRLMIEAEKELKLSYAA